MSPDFSNWNVHTDRCCSKGSHLVVLDMFTSVVYSISREANNRVSSNHWGERSFRFAAATLWNSFPSDVRLSPSLSSFKKNLKTFLFKDAFELYLWTCIVILLCIYLFPLWLLYLQSALSVIKLTDTGAIQVYIIIIINLDEQRKIDESGTWTCDLRIDVPGLYQLSYLALHWRSPLFCQYLCSGAPVRSHETIYCPLARDHAQVTIQPGNRQ